MLAEFPDKIRLVYKDFPLSFHQRAVAAAEAARCAGEHGRFWEYHDLLFVGQPALSDADLSTYARRLDVPSAAFAACLASGRHRDAIKADLAEGKASGVTGTPTFFVNGRILVGAQPLEAFRRAVEEALAKRSDGARP